MSQEQEQEMADAVQRVLVSGDATHADLALMRSGLDAFAAAVSVTVPVHHVQDDQLALTGRSIPVRTYRPRAAGPSTLVWFHGGGYVSGTIEAIDPICRVLANQVRCTVVSVGYRLAPEWPFPAALHDGLEAVAAIAARSPGPVALGGDSAGGGLSAAVARRTPVLLAAQLLLCPWLDATLSSPSVRAKAEGFGLTEQALLGFTRLYLGPDGDPSDPGASPLLDTDFSGLPPTVVVTAGDDPLCDEGELYAARLVAAGGSAAVRRWEGQPHGFVGMTAELVEADEALGWASEQLRALLPAHAR